MRDELRFAYSRHWFWETARTISATRGRLSGADRMLNLDVPRAQGHRGRQGLRSSYSLRMTVKAESPYTLKTGAYSSHSLMMDRLSKVSSDDERVLDVGGGEGYISRVLAERGFAVTCLAQRGSVAPGLPAEIEIVETDLDFELPRFGSFRYVICGDVIEHVRDPSRLLNWLNGLLEPTGRLIASLPNSGHFYFRGNVMLGRFPQHDRGLFDRTHLRFYTLAGWKRLFESSGFVLESVAPTSLPLGLATGLGHQNPIVRAGEALNYLLALAWKRMLAYQFVIVARPEK